MDAIKQYLPKSEATTLGHLDQQRKNIQSTKAQDDDQNTMQTPSSLEQGSRTHALYAATISYNQPTGKLYTDLTGRFPVQSSRAHKYILVAYNFDSNSIHVRPLKSRHDNDTIKAYEDIYDMLKQRGQKPKLPRLSKTSSTRSKPSTSSYRCTFTEETRPSVRYAPLKTISSVVYARWTKIFHYIYGAASSTKRNLPSTCYARRGSIHIFPPMSNSMVFMTSMPHR